jgi:hypothetical protein
MEMVSLKLNIVKDFPEIKNLIYGTDRTGSDKI